MRQRVSAASSGGSARLDHAAGRNRAIAPLGAGRRGDGEQPVHAKQDNPVGVVRANRSWEDHQMVPEGIAHEVTALVRSHRRGEVPGDEAPADEQPPAP